MKSIRTLLGLLMVVAMIFVGCAGKHESPLAPSSTMSSYAQGDEVAISGAAKPTTGKAMVFAKVVHNGLQVNFPDSVQFSRSISGRVLNFEYGGLLDKNGVCKIELPAPGYYVARLFSPSTDFQTNEQRWIELTGCRWGSIPINPNKQYEMEFTVGGNYTMKIVDLPTAINLVKNTAMADANEQNPTAVVGAKDVKLASVGLSVETQEVYGTRELSVMSGLPPGVFGRVFQNLKVKVQNTQIGSTIGTLSDGVITFQFGTTLSTPRAPAFVVADFYGDINSNATVEDLAVVNNRVAGPFIIFNADGFGAVSGDHAQSRESVNGQRVYIIPYGTLEIKSLPLPSTVLPAGASSQLVISKFSATARGEDMSLRRFSWYVSSGAPFMQGNLRLYRNGSLLPRSEYIMNFDTTGSDGEVIILFNNDEIFPQNVKVTFEVKDDTVVSPDAVVLNRGRQEIVTVLRATNATGVVSGQTMVTPRLDPQTIGR